VFTGIVQHIGTVKSVSGRARRGPDAGDAYRLTIALGPLADGLPHGASVAINGVCLTLADADGSGGAFDVIPETWQRTTLADLQANDPVNLERSLRVGDALDGHFVQGHVDAVGRVDRIDRAGGAWKLWIAAPAELAPYVVAKGSIALDGTSLTIVDAETERFSVALIPTTLADTVLGRRQPGDRVNIETDILARLIVNRLAQLDAGLATGGVTWDRLRDAGFVP
jgi:riboflavin synthase